MKLWRYIFGIFLLILCTLFALANDDMVMISLPNVLGTVSGKNIYLPIYLLISLAIFVGVIIGMLIEYMRNFALRKAFNENNKKLLKIEKELQNNKEKFLTEEEKILNLLD
tara:strand:- start:376 stop:708 length:333 start_codon:yes stop_codon:yes gene_type:complete